MEPSTFPEKTRTLQPPPGMDNCVPLDVYSDGLQCISCWRPTWRERLSVLFFGRVWLQVWFGESQPPVAVSAQRSLFEVQGQKKRWGFLWS